MYSNRKGAGFVQGKGRLRRWEAALLVGVAVAAMGVSELGKAQDALAEEVVRLHVVANSDSEAAQALKYKVRDRVLKVAEPMLKGLTREEALAALEQGLPQIAQAAAEAMAENGVAYPVTVSIADSVWFPTKNYADFALPAGDYTALRVELGAGEGQNWWCVVFPPLCFGSVCDISEEAMASGMTEDSVALMTGETEGWVVKFRLVEIWEELKKGLQ